MYIRSPRHTLIDKANNIFGKLKTNIKKNSFNLSKSIVLKFSAQEVFVIPKFIDSIAYVNFTFINRKNIITNALFKRLR